MRERTGVGTFKEIRLGNVGTIGLACDQRRVCHRCLTSPPRPRQNDVAAPNERHRDAVDIQRPSDHRARVERMIGREQHCAPDTAYITHHDIPYHACRDIFMDADARIRTAADIPLDAVIIDQVQVPAYLRIAEKAKHLSDLGMSDKAIARALGVSDKTVAKALECARNT